MKKGDFIEVDFVAKVASTGEVFDLTSEGAAREHKIYKPGHEYRPALVIVGAGMVIKGVDSALEHMHVGDEKEMTIKAGEGFGHRDTKLIRIISMAKFIKDKVDPRPGTFIEIDGVQAKIQSVSGGRVRVDYNHPLAGKELVYKIDIVRQINETEEKVRALIHHYNIKADTELNEGRLVIRTEKKLPKFAEQIIEKPIREWVTEIKDIEFQEKQPPAAERKEEVEEKKE